MNGVGPEQTPQAIDIQMFSSQEYLQGTYVFCCADLTKNISLPHGGFLYVNEYK